MAPWSRRDDSSDDVKYDWGDGSNAPDNAETEFTDKYAAGSSQGDTNFEGTSSGDWGSDASDVGDGANSGEGDFMRQVQAGIDRGLIGLPGQDTQTTQPAGEQQKAWIKDLSDRLVAYVVDGQRKVSAAFCLIPGAVGFIEGAVVGTAVGIFLGGSEAMSAGLRGPDLGRYVGLRVRSSAVGFGSWLGVYTGVRCSMTVIRQKQDLLNTAVAGGCAGALPALRTGNPRVIFFSALGSAGLLTIMEAFSGRSGGERS